MPDPIPTSYDEVLYLGYAFPQTHPNQLATLATMFGMQPTPVTNCRVLELGCGDGGNLIPMAMGLPDSEFVGVDLAARPIENGVAIARDLGLTNVTLRQFDVMEISPDFGEFDYIIAHGLFSWVPEPVREKVLEICRANLTPNGVAYISYNAYPGGHIRHIVRDMMRFHVSHITEPAQQVAQARALLKFVTDAQPESSPYGELLKKELKRVSSRDAYVYHDDLAEVNTPLYFHQFVTLAARFGLKFLAEADFFEMQDHMFPPEMAATLRQLSGQQIELKEQYADFLKCRRFRQTLVCHHEVQLDRDLKPERMTVFYVSCSARPTSENCDPNSTDVEVFRSPKGQSLTTNQPFTKAAMLCLAESWPRGVSFNELLARARARLGPSGTGEEASQSEDAVTLGNMMIQGFGKNLVELHVHLPRLVSTASERPVASPLARLQVLYGTTVTDLWHDPVLIEGQLGQHLLTLLDGTRDRNDLLNELAALIDSGGASVEKDGTPVTDPQAIRQLLAEDLERRLAELARLALLIE